MRPKPVLPYVAQVKEHDTLGLRHAGDLLDILRPVSQSANEVVGGRRGRDQQSIERIVVMLGALIEHIRGCACEIENLNTKKLDQGVDSRLRNTSLWLAFSPISL